jgi:hypothetical protein
MAEMIVNTPETKYLVDDYDFTFMNGMMLPVTVNERVGDTIQFFDTAVVVHLAAKPSMNDPKIALPAEDITIYKTHLATQQHRIREVVALAPEQQHEWAKTLKEISKTVQ